MGPSPDRADVSREPIIPVLSLPVSLHDEGDIEGLMRTAEEDGLALRGHKATFITYNLLEEQQLADEPVSRILWDAALPSLRHDDHSSSPGLAARIERPTRGFILRCRFRRTEGSTPAFRELTQ